MDFSGEFAKYGLAGVCAGLIWVIITIINNNFKERSSNTQERLEAQKMMSVAIQKLTSSVDSNNDIIKEMYQYMKLKNGIADKTSQALAHALEKLGINGK